MPFRLCARVPSSVGGREIVEGEGGGARPRIANPSASRKSSPDTSAFHGGTPRASARFLSRFETLRGCGCGLSALIPPDAPPTPSLLHPLPPSRTCTRPQIAAASSSSSSTPLTASDRTLLGLLLWAICQQARRQTPSPPPSTASTPPPLHPPAWQLTVTAAVFSGERANGRPAGWLVLLRSRGMRNNTAARAVQTSSSWPGS